jgi:hypothetical protein
VVAKRQGFYATVLRIRPLWPSLDANHSLGLLAPVSFSVIHAY